MSYGAPDGSGQGYTADGKAFKHSQSTPQLGAAKPHPGRQSWSEAAAGQVNFRGEQHDFRSRNSRADHRGRPLPPTKWPTPPPSHPSTGASASQLWSMRNGARSIAWHSVA